MAVGRITDIIPIKVISALVEAKNVENSKIRTSGLVSTDPAVDAKVKQGGLELTLRRWNRVPGGEATTGSDDPARRFVPGKVSQGSQLVRMLTRIAGFSAMDIADYVSESDAIEYAINQLSGMRLADEESVLLATLKGILADNTANDSGDMQVARHITSGSITSANLINPTNVLKARATMGDRGGDLKIAIMHSDVVNNLRANEPNNFVPASKTDIGLDRYLNYAVIETDNIGKAGTASFPIYTTYLAGVGLCAYGSQVVDNALVQVRDEFAGDGTGQETVINRYRYTMPVYGYSNVAAPTNGVSQTNAELAAAATWDRVESRKAIPLAAITTNG